MNDTRHPVYAVKFIATDGKPDLLVFANRRRAEAAVANTKGSLHLHMVGESTTKTKLSEPQKAFLTKFARDGYRSCPGGFHDAARAASAWYRTAGSLQDMGLVKVEGAVAYLTWLGLAWTVALLRGEA